MIIIAGDSWACGEWVIDKEQLSHGGLCQYLHDHGYPVINLGTPAGSNAQTINKLNHFFLANGAMKHQIQAVIVIQTEWHRDFRNLNAKNNMHDIFKLANYYGLDPARDIFRQLGISNTKDFHARTMSHFYNQLEKLVEIYQLNCKISLIGGCSDIMTDVVPTDCSSIEIICKSWIDLCLDENTSTTIDLKIPLSLLDYLKKKFNDLDYIIEWMSLCDVRRSKLLSNKDLFYPDGWHPNRIGHKILFDLIIQKMNLR